MPKHLIRSAKLSDRFSLHRVNQASLPVVYGVDQWSEMIAQGLTYVLVISGMIEGYLSCNPQGCIVSFAVSKSYRGQGYGRGLLRYVITTLKQLSSACSQLILRVKVDNLPAQKLYQSEGFQIVEQLNDYYGLGDHAYLMNLNLPRIQTQ